MSDFIPPLISSSPPPMPDFDDDDEDDEDVEFGISPGIGDIDFPGSVEEDCHEEKKDKIIEIDNRRLEINGGTVNSSSWKCEEQDSTSQDSGLCMASQSSEGMSPLPQSDDEDKTSSNHYNDNNNMKHSSTVLFNNTNDIIIDSNCKNNDNSLKFDDALPNDTGQTCDVINNHEILKNTDKFVIKNNFNNDSDSDSEFVWGSTVNDVEDLFQHQVKCDDNDDEIIVNNHDDMKSTDKCDDKNSLSSCIGDNSLHHKSVDNDDTITNINDEQSSTISITNHDSNIVVSDDNKIKNIDNNFCDIHKSINIDDKLTDNQDNIGDNVNNVNNDYLNENDNDDDDDDDDDEFGNFACVTIPNCDSVLNNVSGNDINGVYNNSFSNSTATPNNDGCIKKKRSSDECKIQNEHHDGNVCDLEFKSSVNFENTFSDSDVINKLRNCENDDDDDNKSRHDNLNFKQFSSDGSIVNFNSGDNNRVGDGINENEDDDFDEFSDFTQSTDLPLHIQPLDFSDKNDELSCLKTISTQDAFEEIFPKCDEQIYSDIQTNNLEGGPVWKYLCPLENSPALAFQWSNSQAHNKLLTALSIDSRNILFGPRWNANVPRFAANLGTNPLQPVKAVETQLPVNSLSPIPPSNEEAAASPVPDAHFDWVSSGLTNPLDYVAEKPRNDFEMLNENCKTSSTVENLNILSTEAENIILLLPDLNFMKKTYIEILISKR